MTTTGGACRATWIFCVLALVLPTAYATGPADFLVDHLSLAGFQSTIYDLAALETRYWNKPGNLTAENYLKAKLESYGYTVVLDDYTYLGQPKHNVYATKLGTTTPTQMYIVSAHFDSYNIHQNYDLCPGADDDASGVAAVLEAARVLTRARTDLSVRFILWNNEETGLDGSAAYVLNHRAQQGTLSEPTWVGMIALDMILYDRSVNPPPDADVEFQVLHGYGGQARPLAQAVVGAMANYGAIPAQIGSNMSNTDSASFWDDTAAISIRENRRIAEIGQGSNPNWHEPTDLYATYSQSDYLFGFNIVKMLTGAVGELSGAQPRGDLNCDNVVNFYDINPFIVALAGQAEYEAAYPGCNWLNADCNGDGVVDTHDVNPFVALLSN